MKFGTAGLLVLMVVGMFQGAHAYEAQWRYDATQGQRDLVEMEQAKKRKEAVERALERQEAAIYQARMNAIEDILQGQRYECYSTVGASFDRCMAQLRDLEYSLERRYRRR